MWVRVPEWMVVDGAVPAPRFGGRLVQAGLRIEGELIPASPDCPDSISEVVASGSDPMLTRYRVAGTATDIQAVTADFGDGSRVAVEFVISSSGVRLQAHVKPGTAIGAGTRVTVEGSIWLVGDYEWDAFELVDTRADWSIRGVTPRSRGTSCST